MRKSVRIVLFLLPAICLPLLVIMTAKIVDKVRPQEQVQAFLYIPKNRQLRGFAFGFENEYADLLWIHSLQAVHKQVIDRIRFFDIAEVYEATTDLDPHFKTAYSNGANFIAMIKKSSLEGIQLLENGTQKIPQEPWIWYLLGDMYRLERHHLKRRDEMSEEEATQRAINAMRKAVELGAGIYAQKTLRFLVLRDRSSRFDILAWLEMHKKTEEDELFRHLVEEKLRDHIIAIHLETLRRIIEMRGELPENLEQLNSDLREPLPEHMPQIVSQLLAVSKNQQNREQALEAIRRYILRSLQSQPDARQYIYDPASGEVTSYAVEMDRLQRILQSVQRYVDYRFHQKFARFPNSLAELEEALRIKLPKLPLDKQYKYDPSEGTVSYEPK